MPGIETIQRGTERQVQYFIQVGFGMSRMSRMKLFRHEFQPTDSDIRRQQGVATSSQLFHRPRPICYKMGDLTDRMHTSVSTARTVHTREGPQDPLQCDFDTSLNRGKVFL